MKKTMQRSVLGILLVLAVLLTTCRGGDPKPDTKKYSVIKGFESEGGTFLFFPPSAVEAGKTINLLPTVDNGYELVGWITNPSVTIDETMALFGMYSFKMPKANVTVAAVFDRTNTVKYDVIKGTYTDGNFTITPFSASPGATVALSPEPKPGYEFISWTITPGAISPQETEAGSEIWTFPMPPNDVTVNAKFVLIGSVPKYIATIGTSGNGSFTINPSVAVVEDTHITLEPSPNDGYEFISWTFDPPGTTATPTGNGTWTFPMPAYDLIVNAVFEEIGAAEKYDVNKDAMMHGTFTAVPDKAAEGEWVTLTPAPEGEYEFVRWVGITATETSPGSGQWRFQMPGNDVTIGAVFSLPGVAGVKTLTVESGLGRTPVLNLAGSSKIGTDVWDGTRHITVTVTLEGGAIANVVIGHPIEFPYFVNNNPFRADADNLAAAIKNAQNAEAPFTPAGNYTGAAQTAWNKHEQAIRDAVNAGADAIRVDKPNRTLAGGGAGIPWTADGANISGTATVTGSGYMRGGPVGTNEGNASNLPTDFSVTVVLANGMITSVSAVTDDAYCIHDNYLIGNAVKEYWPSAIVSGNNYNVLVSAGRPSAAAPDAISGATVSASAMRELTKRAIEKLANEY